MTLMEQIQKQIRKLPPESQREVLDFVTFLQLRPRQQPVKTSGANRKGRIKTSLTQLACGVSINHFWFSWAAFKPGIRVYQP